MSTEMPPAGRDQGAAAKLQILATEHWSLLATRSLTYTESLSRVNVAPILEPRFPSPPG